jgi:hypothetical protein
MSAFEKLSESSTQASTEGRSSAELIVIASEDILAKKSKYTVDKIREIKNQCPCETDETIARFLIGANGNVVKALSALHKSIEYKKSLYPLSKSMFMDELLTEKFYVHGCDKEGHPLLVYQVRKNNVKNRDIDTTMKMLMWWVSGSLSSMPADKSMLTILFDRTEAGRENADFELIKALNKIYVSFMCVCGFSVHSSCTHVFAYPTITYMYVYVHTYINICMYMYVYVCI